MGHHQGTNINTGEAYLSVDITFVDLAHHQLLLMIFPIDGPSGATTG